MPQRSGEDDEEEADCEDLLFRVDRWLNKRGYQME